MIVRRPDLIPLASKKALSIINPADWEGQPLPELRWLIEDWLLARKTTFFTGAGAIGKSLLSQQIATCVAAGVPFLGQPVQQAHVCYITAEDDVEELHRRQAAINSALGLTMADLDGWLHMSSLEGETAVLVSFRPEMKVAPLYREIEELIDETGIQLLILDNVAHLFAGNENDRSEVSAFVNLCNRLARQMSGAVLLIGHPNKSGEEYSGSTAWTNVVRTRLFLSVPKEKDGYTDPDARMLSRSKFNYGPRGQERKFRWHKGAFVREDDLPADSAANLARTAAISQQDARFLECLDAAFAQGRNVSHAKGQNYAPKVFAEMPEAGGLPVSAFERALNRLLSTGEIKADQPVMRYENRHVKRGICRAGWTELDV